MAGTLTLGGMADGLLIGEVVIGPASMNGNQAISEILNLTLEAKVEQSVKVPSEAVAFACVFTFVALSGAPSVKLGSNLVAVGYPIPARGWLALPIESGTTELKFKSETATSMFQLVFI
jgi:hypothetical protein